jgi:hypothetical protein
MDLEKCTPPPPEPSGEDELMTDDATAHVEQAASRPEPAHISAVVRELNIHLGATLVAALSGTRNSKEPYSWATGDAQPDVASERRLRLAHRLWHQIAAEESDDIARAWFIGSNPFLSGEDSAVTALREDRFDEVHAAAQAFVTDTWAG